MRLHCGWCDAYTNHDTDGHVAATMARPKRGTVYRVAMCANCNREIHTADEFPNWTHIGFGAGCPDPDE